jgi:ABC-type multidrug transport system ATPase subunit/predicted component of type VI protein secretion system
MNPQSIWLIGSAPDCNISVSSAAVSAYHCRLAQFPNGWMIEDVGSTNGTFVNGQRLTPNTPVWVSRTDQVTLGRSLPMPWPPAAPVRQLTSQEAGVWKRQITIGRAPDCHQVLDYAMISQHHAVLLEDAASQLFLVDLGSTNGTAIGSLQARIPANQPVPLQRHDEIFLGSFRIPVARLLGATKLTLGDAAGGQVQFRGQRMIIGRDPSCDCPLDYPMISWRHAEIAREGAGVFVSDLGSRNGTYVNGLRIASKTPIAAGAEIGLGSYRFTLLDSGDFARREFNGNVSIEAVSLTIDIAGNHRLLNPVSFTILPSEMTAVMGPAGAGKTTLLKALNGYSSPSYGRVLFNGADLYQCYDRFRLQLGYVPQDDIMHALLTVEEALYYTARLRTDLSDEEIDRRIQKVLTDLGIEDIAKRQIGSPEMKVISGGQRKRVNIAMELLSDPNVLFLDEPTSGLSSYDALQVVRHLRGLANQGKTVVLTIHQPSVDIYREFDNLIMVSRDRGASTSGNLAYFGPAYPDSIRFFNPAAAADDLAPEQLLDGLAKQPTDHWVNTYGTSDYRRRYVDERAGQLPQQPQGGSTAAVRGFGFGQWATLIRRNITLRLRDKGQTLFMVMQSTLFPILMTIVFGHLDALARQPVDKWLRYAGNVSTVHFLMVVAAIWFGCNNAARDIVGEWAIFQRERMVSLKLPSYLFAKVAVLAMISLVQCFVLLGIVYVFCGLKAPFADVYLSLFLASQAGAALGLLISAFSKTTESAIAFLPIPLLFMILLGGGIMPLHQMTPAAGQLAKAFPSRWAFEANILMEARERLQAEDSLPSGAPDIAEKAFPVADGDRNSYGTCLAALLSMWAVFLTCVLGVLRKRDIH